MSQSPKSLRKSLPSSQEAKSIRKSGKESADSGVTETPEILQEDGYVLHELLGEGSYSKVYRATNETKAPGVNYACKRYKIDKQTIKWVERCLRRELTLAMKVQHHSIVEAFSAVKSGNEAFLILQYAPNGSIRDYLRKKLEPDQYLSENKVCTWMSDLFAAVAYLHGKEIAHRDIKTDNFLLDELMKPLLCDFSFACVSDKPHTRFVCMVDTVCGTSAYLAPEVHALARGQRYDAKIADVFAMGVSLYECFVKKVPYMGRYRLSDPQLIERQNKLDYVWPDKLRVSEEGKALVRALLEPRPAYRISINRALLHRWFTDHKVTSSRKTDKALSDDFRKQQSTGPHRSSKSHKPTKNKPASHSSKSHKSSASSKKSDDKANDTDSDC